MGYKLQNLDGIGISSNRITGTIPSYISNCSYLTTIYFDSNGLSGPIPNSLGELRWLELLDLFDNNLTTESSSVGLNIVSSLANCRYLRELWLSNNALNTVLPSSFGNIPSAIGGLQELQYIILANNLLQGSIPNTFASMISLEHMDLSNNNLMGRIPKSLETLLYLKFLNVSFNKLSGEIPSKGPFKQFGYLSFLSNEGLCGSSRLKVPPCNPNSNSHRSIRRLLWIVLISIAILIVGISSVGLHKCKSKKSISTEVILFQEMVFPRISYYELQQATQGFDSSNLLGTGSFGSVYKGIFTNGSSFAIKVFNLQVEGAFKSFDIECQVLRNLRHRNLTKVISACSNLDFKALILQYMPHGSLDNWLYSENQSLNIMQRLNIMIDVACGLEYLHYGNSIPVVHCDLKPSNVLLDEDMVGHVSDFGISKLLGDDRSIAYTCTMATIGYIAPEYGSRGMVSTRSDVYSYGIMLMEVFTRKRPSNEMFSGDLSLQSWVYNSLSNTPDLIVDSTLLRAEELQLSQKLQYISTILELALNCTVESPKERVDIRHEFVIEDYY
ncbi:probable LRR receptor-like serine/threonine-protein kinase At3g47570 [Ipomoea triloba]|uniref:probable LRR receptor-like serine/threonine-protein kinase At3g47570 n=1 Tax=Ipomoea triloba TaxID=35885 RepID=UPI00125E8BD0|nr:probable LRR receptor-like serine/threonine-protein kinase At3g47570 [Ipomoea triloba]